MPGAGNGRHGVRTGASWLATEPLDIVQATLLPLTPVQPPDSGEDRIQAVRQCVLDPVYQLK